MRGPWVAVLVASVLVFLPQAARAEQDPLARPTKAEARAHLERGEALYELQRWDEAIAELEKGALLEPDLPMWFLSLGQAHRQAGHYERARWHYERFLSRIEGMPGTDEIVATVRGLVEDMKAAESRPPVDLAPASSPPPTTDRVDPTRTDRVERTHASRWTTSRKVSLGVGAGGLVAAGVGVALSFRALGLRDDAEALCPTLSCQDAAAANALADRADANDRNALIAYGVGGAAVVGAVVLWIVGAPHDPGDERVVSVQPRLHSTFAGVDLSVRY